MKIDPAKQVINGVRLTKMQWQIACELQSTPRTLSYAEIAYKLWGLKQVDHSDRECIRFHILSLRRRLGSDVVKTVIGVGYQWGRINEA